MGYRIKEHRRPKPNRTLVDIATPAKVFVHNGTIAHLAFPCWYQEVHKPVKVHPHSKHYHDYRGWPGPGKPDHSCQLWTPDLHCCKIGEHHECTPHCEHYISMDGVIPIHLRKEGYTDVKVTFQASDEQPSAIYATGIIDPEDDWIVRVSLDILDENAVYEPQVYKMTVFANANDRRDIVALTELIVLPSGYAESDIEE